MLEVEHVKPLWRCGKVGSQVGITHVSYETVGGVCPFCVRIVAVHIPGGTALGLDKTLQFINDSVYDDFIVACDGGGIFFCA